MKKKNLDPLMIVLSVVMLAVFAASIYTSGSAIAREGKHVGSIAEITVPDVPDVTTQRAYGVVSAEEWSPYYADIYKSYMENANNTGHGGTRISYVETDPDIQTLYQGMGFAFDYTEAIGHSYTLDDIAETTRPHKLANCLTCKTPDFTAMVNAMGTDAYGQEFDSVYAQLSEPVSCYNCHGNTPGTMVLTHDYMKDAMGDEVAAGRISGSVASCAQCHIEYYFDKDTKATSVPYDSPDNFDPDSILAFYNKMGFVDFTNENTGVGMIKVQHPEFETFMGEGSVHKGTYTCADCHMGVAYNAKGYPYANHLLTSPLDNAALLKDTCSMCHNGTGSNPADVPTLVKSIQEEITGREKVISGKLVQINTKLAAAIQSGSLADDVIEQIKKLDRDAQFYWDFVYVENAEGAHNSALSRQCLDKAEQLADQALALLG